MFVGIIHVMETVRTINHGNGHIDIERLKVTTEGESVWAIIKCTYESERKMDRCETGKELLKSWRVNYDDVVKSGGDWMSAFCDPRYYNHELTCPICQAYDNWKYHQPMDADEAQARGVLPADEAHIRQIDECTCGSNPDAPACSYCRDNPIGEMPY